MKFKLVEDVIGAFDELGAAPDQRMTVPGKRIVDRPRDGKHLASLRAGQACGNQRAAVARRLDHQRAQTQTADNSVTTRKVGSDRRRTGRILAYQRSLGGNARGEGCMMTRVDRIDTGA